MAQLTVIGHRHGDRRGVQAPLRHNVAAALAYLHERLRLQDATDFTAERTRSLPNRDLERRYVHFGV